MKKLFGVLLTATLVLGFGTWGGVKVAQAIANGAAGKSINVENLLYEIPEFLSGGGRDIFRAWTKPSIVTVNQTTTCSNPFDGDGIIVSVQVSSAPANAFDESATNLGYAVIRDSDTVNASGNAIGYFQAKSVTHVGTDTGSAKQDRPFQELRDGLPFSNGLVVCNSDALVSTTVLYRKLRVAR